MSSSDSIQRVVGCSVIMPSMSREGARTEARGGRIIATVECWHKGRRTVVFKGVYTENSIDHGGEIEFKRK